MTMYFIGRKQELEELEREYLKPASNLIIVYGRRRVGKTYLIERFIQNRNAIYYMADEKPASEQLRDFSGAISKSIGAQVQFESWMDAFKFLTKAKNGKIIVVIDEFPNLISSDKSILSQFQRIWDVLLQKEKIMVILVGSSISVMENEVLSYKSPLYARRTAQLFVKPLSIPELWQFYGDDLETVVKKYAMVDGIPAYANHLKGIPFPDCIKEFLHPFKFLYNELHFLIHAEFREVSHYFAILHAIADGSEQFSKISQYTGISMTNLPFYLNKLIALRLIRKEYPSTQAHERRNAHYIIADKYIDFWFRFIYKYRMAIERGKGEEVLQYILKDFPKYIGRVFEDVVNDLIYLIAPFMPIRSGRWWHKDKEIDIVAINDVESEKKILFIEVKWGENVDGAKVERELIKKSQFVEWNKGHRTEYFMIIARGFRTKPKSAQFLTLSDLASKIREKWS